MFKINILKHSIIFQVFYLQDESNYFYDFRLDGYDEWTVFILVPKPVFIVKFPEPAL